MGMLGVIIDMQQDVIGYRRDASTHPTRCLLFVRKNHRLPFDQAQGERLST